jgi:hypothetical protein
LHCLRANEREYYIDTRMQKEEKRWNKTKNLNKRLIKVINFCRLR